MLPRRRRQQASISFHANAISDEEIIENTALELTPEALMEQLYQAIQQYPSGSALRAAGIIVYQDLNSLRPQVNTFSKNRLHLWRMSAQLATNLLNDFTDANIRALKEHGTYSKLGNMRRPHREIYDALLVSADLIAVVLMILFISAWSTRAINAVIALDAAQIAALIFFGLAVFHKISRRSGIIPIFMEISAYLRASLASHLRYLAQVPSGKEEYKALLDHYGEAERAFMGKITAETFKPHEVSVDDINKIIGSYFDIEDREKLITGLSSEFILKATQERIQKRDVLRNEKEAKTTISRMLPGLPQKAAAQINSFLDRKDKLSCLFVPAPSTSNSVFGLSPINTPISSLPRRQP